jgi:RNA polymerase sigma factor (sigma-70 family)
MDLELLARAQEGDTAARDRIVHENLGLVRRFARRYSRDDREKYAHNVGIGYEGLVAAINKYDHTKGYTFSTYAAYRIIGKILTGKRDEKRRDRRFGDCLVAEADGRPLVASAVDSGLSSSERAELNEEVEKLNLILVQWKSTIAMVRYATIIELFFGIDPDGPMDYRQIGERLGLSRERVRVLADRAFSWVCQSFGQPAGRKCSGNGLSGRKVKRASSDAQTR